MEASLIRAAGEFRRTPLERSDQRVSWQRPDQAVPITVGLAAFCAGHVHRMPHGYWDDPLPRARAYLRRRTPPWEA
ncbi:hypothetical protein AB0J74_26450 [Asanoa sp. NPDC049573]|uniref:hypothetical protein n=1 Tax=Asanoa sp. NPDC049573 TaxID=3155396 RepID=UPI0034371643